MYFTLQILFNFCQYLHLIFCSDGAGTNKQHVITKNTAKLDRETEELKHDKIPLEVGKIIQEGRKNKGLKQSDLAAVSEFIITIFIFAEYYQYWFPLASQMLFTCNLYVKNLG